MRHDPQAVQLLGDKFGLLDKLPAPAAGKARELLQGVLGGAASPKADSPKDGGKSKNAPNLGDAARGLLKGFGR